MKRVLMAWGVTILAAGAGTGCASSRPNLETTFQDIHQRVAKIEKTADTSIGKLDETAAGLSAKVADHGEQASQLRAVMEENEKKTAALARDARTIKEGIYRAQGITVVPRAGISVSPTPRK